MTPSCLLIPYTEVVSPLDLRLARIADFCGVPWETTRVRVSSTSSLLEFDKPPSAGGECLVLNASVLSGLLSVDQLSSAFAESLTQRFPFILIYALAMGPFTDALLQCLSEGTVNAVHQLSEQPGEYRIDREPAHMLGPFAGLRFGPADRRADLALDTRGLVHAPVRVGDAPLLAVLEHKGATVFVIARRDVVDLSAAISDIDITDYFSALVPAVMVMRSIFGERAWTPRRPHATLVVDDPLLRPRYGFLTFDDLLRAMEAYDFHTTVAFIPYNHRRTAPHIANLFAKRRDRFSLCFHGNDHTGAEFATESADDLNVMLRIARDRMAAHETRTSIESLDVMVFPQNLFSVAAMKALKRDGFVAAVNSTLWPHHGPSDQLTVRDLVQPAVLKYHGFPLFLRRDVDGYTAAELASYLFFGKPLLICAHHDTFRDTGALTRLVSLIYSMAPMVQWTDLRTTLVNAGLRRVSSNGVLSLSVCTNEGRIENDLGFPVQYVAEKPETDGSDVWDFTVCGSPHSFLLADGCLRWCSRLGVDESHEYKIACSHTIDPGRHRRTLHHHAKVFLRRRLSELRDNYLSKNSTALGIAQQLRRHLIKGA